VERKKINSGRLRSAGYDARERVLEIEFTDGSVYRYGNVSSDLYRRFDGALSKSSFFEDNLEEGLPKQRVR
jgi:KTSC domain